MEDSSTNPYIPQESDQIRQKVYERQSPLGRFVKWALIITGIVALLVAIGLFFVVPRTTAIDQPARVKLADALQPPDQTLKRVSVVSQLGFKLNYDNRVYSSYAEVGDSTSGTDASSAIISGQTYENNDLRAERGYNYVRIRPIESVDTSRALLTIPPELEIFSTVTNKDLTTAAAVPENKNLSKLSLFVKIDGDKRQAEKVADDNTIVTIDATKAVSATVNGVEYQKVRYTTTNDNHRISNVKYDDCYYTIQYDQPYSICISNVRPTNVSVASLVEDVFKTLTFSQPQTSDGSSSQTTDTDTSKKTSYLPLALLTQATTNSNSDSSSSTTDSTDSSAADATDGDSGDSPLLTVTPNYYNDANSLESIAKAQPSVVRIGSLYCTDLALKQQSGDTLTTLTDACVGNVASGVFVSSDGYVATTGHAIRQQKKAALGGYINFAANQDDMMVRLQRILDYLLETKLILQSDADYIKTGAQTGDQEAIAKIENIGSVIPDNFITALNEQYSYAVQPTDKPIVVNKTDSNKPAFAYSDSVLSAKYVASKYEAENSIQEKFDSSTPADDIGILKVDGSFPNVIVANNDSFNANDTLNTIGYPAYTDSSLTIDKIRNLPVATVSKVDQAFKQNGVQLVQTDSPVLPGNDGAPVFNNTGQLVGFAVYGLSYCPDQNCFANGTVRPASGLLTLLDTNNIKLATGSKASASWNSAIDNYFKSNYAASAGAFSSASSDYAFNRWAEPLQKLSASLEGSAKDTSLMNQLQSIMIAALIVLVVVTILLAIAFFVHKRRISYLQVGHYGAAAPVPVSAPLPIVQQPIQPVATQQQGYYPQQPLPQSLPTQEQGPVAPPQYQYPGQQPPSTLPTPTQPPVAPPVQQQPPQSPPEDPFYK